MADENIKTLNDQLLSDDELRARFREDPAGVVREAGIDLNPEQEARLVGAGWADKAEDELIATLQDTGLIFWF